MRRGSLDSLRSLGMTLTLTPTRGVEPRVPRGGRTRASAPPRRCPTPMFPCSPPRGEKVPEGRMRGIASTRRRTVRRSRPARELDHLLQLPQPLRRRRLQPDLAVELRLLGPSGELFGRFLRVSHENKFLCHPERAQRVEGPLRVKRTSNRTCAGGPLDLLRSL